MSPVISRVSSPSAAAASATAGRSDTAALGTTAAAAGVQAVARSEAPKTSTTRMAVLTDDHSAPRVRRIARWN